MYHDIFSSNVLVFSLRSLMSKILDKLLETPQNPTHELPVLGCGVSVCTVRGTCAPSKLLKQNFLLEETSSPVKCHTEWD